MDWREQKKANMDEYRAKHDIRVICDSAVHETPVHMGSFSRVSGRLTSSTTKVQLQDDFMYVGEAMAPPGEYTRRHDAGLYSTSLTHDVDEPLSDYESRRRPSRNNYKLKCPECPNDVPVRHENIQPILKQMEGKATIITLHMLRRLLRNQ